VAGRLHRAAGRRAIVGRLKARLRARFSFYGRELPPTFWFLWAGTLVNRLGGFAVPFLMLYLTERLAIAPAAAALMVSLLGAGSFLAQLVGGELADRLGRRPVMLVSFFVTPVAMVGLGLVRDPALLVAGMFLLGFFNGLSRPAVNAAVVDLVPSELRTRAFAYIYWAINLGAALAPIAAGLLANYDYFLLFLGDGLTTAVFGLIVFVRVGETRPDHTAERVHGGVRGHFGQLGREPILLVFSLLALLTGAIYSQAQVTLPLAMAASGLPPSDYGLAIAVNGGLIVLVTLRTTRIIESWPRFTVMAVATLLLGAGFGLTAIADTLPAYALTVVVWTVGEIVSAAVAPAIIGDLSPPHLRGLYQGVWGAAWGLAFFVGPVVGGYIFGNLGGATLWVITFALGLVLAVGYVLLAVPAAHRLQPDTRSVR
jgi:MFS family permease